MKLVLFENPGDAEPRPGLLTERGIVDICGHVAQGYTPQLTMQGIIDDFERLRPVLEQQQARGEAKPVDSVRLRPPLPRPGRPQPHAVDGLRLAARLLRACAARAAP